MAKFRKKPAVIEAVRFDGFNFEEVEAFVIGPLSIQGTQLFISTLEGKMGVSVGDWIIRGVKGEYYPCKPDIFAVTYEWVEE